MRKAMDDYGVYVFDLDGTLYDQPKLRLRMALRLAFYYALHPYAVRQLFILQYFRKVKDNWTGSSSEEEIIHKVASDIKTDADSVRMIVRKWIYEEPLGIIAKTKDKKLAEYIKRQRSSGRKVVIFSDYPTKEKLEALSIEADGQYCTLDPRIDALKPSPKGLFFIMEDLGVSADDMLVIGDREEKDGASAKAAGVDCLILPRHVAKRKLSFENEGHAAPEGGVS